MDLARRQTTPARLGRWWFLWLVVVGVGPPVAGAMQGRACVGKNDGSITMGVSAATFLLHLVCSCKLGSTQGRPTTAMLVVGGWILMGALFFGGCISNLGF